MDLNWVLEEYDGMVYVSDLHTYELLYMNKKGCELFGITKEDIKRGLKCHQVLQGIDVPCPFCTNDRLQESSFYEWEHYNDRIDRTYLLKDRKVTWDGRAARIEFAFDVSSYHARIERKKREQESLLKSLPGGVVRLDARDRQTILWYGANFLNIIGYTKEQLEQELNSKASYVHPEDAPKIKKCLEELKESGGMAMIEARIVTREKAVRTLMTTFSYEAAAASQDGIPSFYSIGIDITEIKARQETQHKVLKDVYHAVKMADVAKTSFLSNMSHDIRTPMNAILGMTSIARSNLNDTQKVGRCLDKITTASKHLLGLINEILDMSKIENGKIDLEASPFNLAEVVQNVLAMCQPLLKGKNHQIKIDIENLVHENIVGDAERLQQVFLNFLSNAIKYTPPEGKISFIIMENPSQLEGFSQYIFVFKDNGIGMTEEFMKRIFEPFSRAMDPRADKVQGTGLGMTISENIIHMMNGTIQVESELDKGSCFTVSVPLKIQNETGAQEKDLLGLPVLAVDDDADMCESTCLLLQEIGMKGTAALSGQEALRELSDAHKRKEDYFAVLLDWRMPGMDGLDTIKAIRWKVGLAIPIIVVSSYDYSYIETAFINAGADAFVSKPLFKSKLVHVLRQFVNLKQRGEGEELPKIDFSGRRLLLAEDNEINMEIVKELFATKGALVDGVENGEAVVKKFVQSPYDYYDLVLMDIQMPVLNGYEAATAIRALDRRDANDVPILALTANVFSEDIVTSINAGMNGHIAKPIDAGDLYETVQKWLPARKPARRLKPRL